MSFGRTWWGKRWLRIVESLGVTYPDSRMTTARTLARSDVDLLTIEPGELSAWVDQPRRSFGVSIGVPRFDEDEWERVGRALGRRLRNLADLLDDRLPTRVDDQLADTGLGLFPRGEELDVFCPCRDKRTACVHVIAVLHSFASRFDDDPFLLSLLRGRDRDSFLAGLRRDTVHPEPPDAPVRRVPIASLSADDFYGAEADRAALVTAAMA